MSLGGAKVPAVYWSRRSDFGPSDDELLALRRRALDGRRGALPPVDLCATHLSEVGLSLPDWGALLAPEARYQPDPQGLLGARRSLAERYQSRAPGLTAEAICLLSSTSEAYLWLLHLLCDPGDAVLVPSPSYPLLHQLAAQAGVRMIPYQLRYAGGWDLDRASLPNAEARERERIRAVVAVSPNHPTGSFVSQSELLDLAALDLPLIVDEVFRPYVLDRAQPSEPLALPGLTFVLDGLSKRAAAPGLKLGWVVAQGSRVVVREALARLTFLADTLLATNGPVQGALPGLLAREAEAQAVVLDRLRANLRELRRQTAGTAISVLPVDAGFHVICRLPALLEERAYLEGLARRGVWAHPGELYGLVGPPALVLSLLVPPEAFATGISRLLDVVMEVAGASEAGAREGCRASVRASEPE